MRELYQGEVLGADKPLVGLVIDVKGSLGITVEVIQEVFVFRAYSGLVFVVWLHCLRSYTELCYL